ncbi:pentapeptide repeat-containing protein [Saccharopolyspora shandongensis]|uniref:pentapeptide repeat-containing protein n=1 Tax=Saccharopolyspora shandongensis TaxID=418495 RepID=UPI0033DE702F
MHQVRQLGLGGDAYLVGANSTRANLFRVDFTRANLALTDFKRRVAQVQQHVAESQGSRIFLVEKGFPAWCGFPRQNRFGVGVRWQPQAAMKTWLSHGEVLFLPWHGNSTSVRAPGEVTMRDGMQPG